MSTDNKPYAIGDTLKSLHHVSRHDGRASIVPGDLVKVIQQFQFTFEGRPCQDITVQKGDSLPITVIAAPGRFEKIP